MFFNVISGGLNPETRVDHPEYGHVIIKYWRNKVLKLIIVTITTELAVEILNEKLMKMWYMLIVKICMDISCP